MGDHHRRSAPLTGALALGGILALAFLPVLTGRQSLLPLQPGVMPDGPYGYAGPRPEPAVYDPAASATKFVPYYHFIAAEWRAGRLPFWNPHAGGGIPLLANAENFVLAPLRLPLYLAPGRVTWNAFYLGRLWLAGCLAFLLARALGLGGLPATTAGAAYMLGGYLLMSLNLMHIDVDILLPGLLLGLDRLIRRPSPGAFLLTAGAGWGMGLGGNAQALVAGWLLAAGFGALRILQLPRRRRWAAAFPPAIALGAAVAGALVHWVPLAELVSRAHHLHGAGGPRSGTASIPVSSLLGLLGPWVSDSLMQAPFYYAGVLPLGFAAAGAIAAVRRKTRNVAMAYFAAAAAVDALKIVGLPGLNHLGALPVFSQVWWPKYAAPLFLSLALLCGWGVAATCAAVAWRRRGTAATALAALVVAELLVLRPGPHPAPHDPLRPAPYIEWLQRRQAEHPGARLCGVGRALMPMTATAFRLNDLRVEDTLIDRDQYRRLNEGFAASRPPRLRMWLTLDGLDGRRLTFLRNHGVRWLVAEPAWSPPPALAPDLELAYRHEMAVFRLRETRAFGGFPERGRGWFHAGLAASLLLTPPLLIAGLRRVSPRPRRR